MGFKPIPTLSSAAVTLSFSVPDEHNYMCGYVYDDVCVWMCMCVMVMVMVCICVCVCACMCACMCVHACELIHFICIFKCHSQRRGCVCILRVFLFFSEVKHSFLVFVCSFKSLDLN